MKNVDEPMTFTLFYKNSNQSDTVRIDLDDSILNVIYKFNKMRTESLYLRDRIMSFDSSLLDKNFIFITTVLSIDELVTVLKYFLHSKQTFDHLRDSATQMLMRTA